MTVGTEIKIVFQYQKRDVNQNVKMRKHIVYWIMTVDGASMINKGSSKTRCILSGHLEQIVRSEEWDRVLKLSHSNPTKDLYT